MQNNRSYSRNERFTCQHPDKNRPPTAFGMDAAVPDDFPLFTVQIFDPVGIVATAGMLGAGAK